MKSNIVREVDIKKVAEFLVNQEKEKLLKEEKEKEKEKEKPDDIQSLELLLGMKVVALWVEPPYNGSFFNENKDIKFANDLLTMINSNNRNNIPTTLNIRCLQEIRVDGGRADVEMTMVWQFKELKDFNPLDFVPEGSK